MATFVVRTLLSITLIYFPAHHRASSDVSGVGGGRKIISPACAAVVTLAIERARQQRGNRGAGDYCGRCPSVDRKPLLLLRKRRHRSKRSYRIGEKIFVSSLISLTRFSSANKEPFNDSGVGRPSLTRRHHAVVDGSLTKVDAA